MRKYIFILLLTAVLVAADYFLFRGYELVFPFFLLPYILVSILYIVRTFRDSRGISAVFIVYLTVIIPVYAGLVMCLAWMLKINFWGELVGGYLIR